MKPSQFFTFAAMIYLAPHMPALVGGSLGVAFLIMAGLMMAIKQ